MKKEFVTYQQSVALRDLGFDEPCIAWYSGSKIEGSDIFLPTEFSLTNLVSFTPSNSMLGEDMITVPLRQQVLRWFRDKGYRFSIYFDISEEDRYMFDIFKRGEKNEWKQLDESRFEFTTYEESEDRLIDKLIELLKNERSNIT